MIQILSLLVLAFFSRQAQAVSVVCNGGDGAPYWAYTMNECLDRARTKAGNDAKEIAREGERAEKRARDAKRVADRLSADRRAAMAKSPAERSSLLPVVYVLPASLASAAKEVVAYQNTQGGSDLRVPRTYRELLDGSEDLSVQWKRRSTYEAESAAYLFEAATGGLDAAKKFNDLSRNVKRRGDSLISLDRGQTILRSGNQSADIQAGASQKIERKGGSGSKSGEISAQEKSGAISQTGPGSRIWQESDAKTKLERAATDSKSMQANSVMALEKNAELSRKLDLVTAGDKKVDMKKQEKKVPGQELDFFEQAMNKVDIDSDQKQTPTVQALENNSVNEQAAGISASLFERVSRQYHKREALYFSPFRE